ncbi:hypothetical protein [Caldivirga maquilingensis]|uniref:Uncharacterized protein n=1 Tax=Caldivirga maquilingensis (strain ATCC 700844 / DSM 13496 / JCM 10307 / IC-167) TaxID=397948 RepID=A8M8U7_CALMQ|nr:hypothetical protein [Caldivirga maquilingensis]ABW02166.1 conserved hypothetical protein [Caldivirga maquilingensis IC-167]
MRSKRYYVLLNPWEARILVTGKLNDLELVQVGWRIVMASKRWYRAYDVARTLADKFNYVLEWYIEDERRALAIDKSRSVKP